MEISRGLRRPRGGAAPARPQPPRRAPSRLSRATLASRSAASARPSAIRLDRELDPRLGGLERSAAPLETDRRNPPGGVRARSWSDAAAATYALGQVRTGPWRLGADHPCDLAQVQRARTPPQRARPVRLRARTRSSRAGTRSSSRCDGSWRSSRSRSSTALSASPRSSAETGAADLRRLGSPGPVE